MVKTVLLITLYLTDFTLRTNIFNFFTLDKYWQVTPKDIYAEVINDIKRQKNGYILIVI